MLVTSTDIDKEQNCEKCPSHVHRIVGSLSLSSPIDNNKPRLTELTPIFIFEESTTRNIHDVALPLGLQRITALRSYSSRRRRNSALPQLRNTSACVSRLPFYLYFPTLPAGAERTYPRRLVRAREKRGVESAIRANTSKQICLPQLYYVTLSAF